MFTKGQWFTLIWIAVSLTLLIVGCAQQPTVSTASFPMSQRFKTSVLDWGEFITEFQGDGTLVSTRTGYVTIRGTFSVAGDKLTIKGILCDQPDKASGTYTWVYDGQTLYLNSSDDKCSDRFRVFNNAWSKQ